MKRVTGIGGVFYKSRDPEHAKRWYREHLGMKTKYFSPGVEAKKLNVFPDESQGGQILHGYA